MARSGLQISDLVMFGVSNQKNELSPSSGGVGRPSAAYYDQELTIQVDWTTFWEVSERPNTYFKKVSFFPRLLHWSMPPNEML